jgi:hypothetical protein
MPRGTVNSRYSPSHIPEVGNVELQEWLRRELRSIQTGIIGAQDFEVLYEAPEKLREGMVRYADGTLWNPGGGKGLYVYNGTTWTKL